MWNLISTWRRPAASDSDDARSLPAWLRAALLVVIVAGILLRVIWPGTTVFCDDQARACAIAQDIAEGRWQSAGLVNSGGFRNPPGFACLLAAAWRIWPSPMGLLAFISTVNVAALLVAAWLMRRWAGTAAALWGTAFFAASPWAIQYCRWIWAQDLLFPAALLVYLFLSQWATQRRAWAACGVVVSLALVAQIHLSGVVLAVALAMWWLWRRPRVHVAPLVVGLLLAAATFAPWLLDGHLARPAGDRIDYRQTWRTAPAAAMSVTGLNWSLEFRGGYDAFCKALSWRRWPYEAVMLVPAVLLAAAVVARLRSARRGDRNDEAVSDAARLCVTIAAAFVLLGIRVSPTFMPIWYPLPFVVMGWFAARRIRAAGWQAATLLVLAVQLAFFAEQLSYIRRHDGVPGSSLSRSAAGLQRDIAAIVPRVRAAEIWMQCDDPGTIQKDAWAWLLRRAAWQPAGSGRAVLRLTPGRDFDLRVSQISSLEPGRPPPPGAYLVLPWRGPQQRNGRVLRVIDE